MHEGISSWWRQKPPTGSPPSALSFGPWPRLLAGCAQLHHLRSHRNIPFRRAEWWPVLEGRTATPDSSPPPPPAVPDIPSLWEVQPRCLGEPGKVVWRAKLVLSTWFFFREVRRGERREREHLRECVLCSVTQLCPTLRDPMDCSLPGSSVHGDFPGNNTGVGWHALFQGIFPIQGSNPSLSHCRWILYHLSHREAHESWSGQPIPSPGNLPHPGIKPGSPALQADSLPAELPGKPTSLGIYPIIAENVLLLQFFKKKKKKAFFRKILSLNVYAYFP